MKRREVFVDSLGRRRTRYTREVLAARNRARVRGLGKKFWRDYLKWWRRDTAQGRAYVKRTAAHEKVWRHARRLAKRYGFTVEQVFRMQREPCEVCGGRTKRKQSLDHSHKTGKFRGVLCVRCNGALGLLRESPRIIKRLLRYVRRTR